MYNAAQVIIDLEEYNHLKKKAEQFEGGSDDRKERVLALIVSKLLEATSNASMGMKPDYTKIVIDIAKQNSYSVTGENGTVQLTEIK